MRDHPRGYGLVSRGMRGKEKKRVFSKFGMNAVVHKKISREESVKSFVSNAPSAPNRNPNISWLLGDLERHALLIHKASGVANAQFANVGLRNSPI